MPSAFKANSFSKDFSVVCMLPLVTVEDRVQEIKLMSVVGQFSFAVLMYRWINVRSMYFRTYRTVFVPIRVSGLIFMRHNCNLCTGRDLSEQMRQHTTISMVMVTVLLAII